MLHNTIARNSRSGPRPLLLAVCLLALVGGSIASAQGAVCRVATGGNATNSGSSWATPMDLRTALAASDCNEIWVAAGVYKPSGRYSVADIGDDLGNPRTATFNILPGRAVYGGFAGDESARSQRDSAANLTILSGDIDNNDVTAIFAPGIVMSTDDIRGANAFHVVTLDGTTGTPVTPATVLDGFVITAGSAPYPGGGGVLCSARIHAEARCDPTFDHLVFIGNATSHNGGALLDDAIYGGSASPTISNSTFIANRAHAALDSDAWGGAIYNEGNGGNASPILTNVTFVGNRAKNGGAVYNSGYYGISSPVFINATFTGNAASDTGGAIYSWAPHGTCVLSVVNTILWADGAIGGGDEIYNDTADGSAVAAVISHSIVAGSGGSVAWDVSLGSDAGGNLDADPLLGSLLYQGGVVPTMALPIDSPAIDAGDDETCPLADARGVTRPQGKHCDLGAFESTDSIFADGFDQGS